MTKNESLEKLNTLIEQLDQLPNYNPNGTNPEFEKWHKRTSRCIRAIWGDPSEQIQEFENISFSSLIMEMRTPWGDSGTSHNNIKAHNKGRYEVKTFIESLIEEVEEWKDESIDTDIEIIKKYDKLIDKADDLKGKAFNLQFGLKDYPKEMLNEEFQTLKVDIKELLSQTVEKDSRIFSKFKLQDQRYNTFSSDSIAEFYYILNRANGLIMKKIENKSPIEDKKKHLSKVDKTKVFIVHGHDELAITQVSDFIRKLKIEPIILKDQTSSSNTVIEKIEEHTINVGFGVILYTECDVGGTSKGDLKSRARQNVVLEHGYLMARIGRKNTFALVKGKVETPGDISGMVYTKMDDNKAWELTLARELIASSYDIDLNLLA